MNFFDEEKLSGFFDLAMRNTIALEEEEEEEEGADCNDDKLVLNIIDIFVVSVLVGIHTCAEKRAA